MTIAAELARRIGAISFEALPPEAVSWAKVGILDTVGVTLAGGGRETAPVSCRARWRRIAAGPALLFGTGRRVGALDAALINGTAVARARFRRLQQHARRPSLGADAAGAVRAGRTRKVSRPRRSSPPMSPASRPRRKHRARRSTSITTRRAGIRPRRSACSARPRRARTCCGLDRRRRPRPRSRSPPRWPRGIKANFGTMTKPLHVGHAARNGLFAALLADDGLYRQPRRVRAQAGLLRGVQRRRQLSTPSAILADWATPLDIVEPGIADQAVSVLRLHASGRSTPCWRCVREHALTPERRSSAIDSWTHPRRLAAHQPARSAKRARRQVQRAVLLARALLHGQRPARAFRGRRLRDADVRALMPRIHAAPASRHEHGQRPTISAREVRVRRATAGELTAKVERPLGRGPDNPLPAGALEAKFRRLRAAARWMPPAAERALQTIDRLDGLADVGDLLAMLAGGCRAATTPGRALPTAAE